VVIDVKSTGLFYSDPVLEKARNTVVTWKTGHSYIKSKVAQTDAMAGFEKSGHWFFNRPFGRGYDDALASSMYVLRFLSESGRRLSELVDALPVTWQSPTLGVFCPDDAKYRVVDGVTQQYEADFRAQAPIGGLRIKEIIKVNGVRFVLEDDSWGLVRASSNKPSLVVVAEARSAHEQLYDIVDHVKARLASTGEVGEYDQELPPRPQSVHGRA
jgi:phosphomannomutase/phosphoglucomutase